MVQGVISYLEVIRTSKGLPREGLFKPPRAMLSKHSSTGEVMEEYRRVKVWAGVEGMPLELPYPLKSLAFYVSMVNPSQRPLKP